VQRAPDCERKATFPGLIIAAAKVAFKFFTEYEIPRQFGPTIRIPVVSAYP
jgi:hypothetical protein